MKQPDIEAVLTQAAELRANLCTAIDRSLHAHFHNLPISPTPDEDENGGDDGEYDALPLSSAAAAAAVSEARSLASIRDALEVLEEQLECLQSLPDMRRAEKNATLAELEESRGILIRRLKQHRGRQFAVIREALSFAGEPREEVDYPLPRSYTIPGRFLGTDWRHSVIGGDEINHEDAHTGMEKCRSNSHRKRKVHMSNDGSRPPPSRNLLSDLKSRVLTFLNRRLARVSANCLFAVVGAAAVWTLSNAAYGNNISGRRVVSYNGRQRGGACPQNWTPVQSGGQRCVPMEPYKEDS